MKAVLSVIWKRGHICRSRICVNSHCLDDPDSSVLGPDHCGGGSGSLDHVPGVDAGLCEDVELI